MSCPSPKVAAIHKHCAASPIAVCLVPPPAPEPPPKAFDFLRSDVEYVFPLSPLKEKDFPSFLNFSIADKTSCVFATTTVPPFINSSGSCFLTISDKISVRGRPAFGPPVADFLSSAGVKFVASSKNDEKVFKLIIIPIKLVCSISIYRELTFNNQPNGIFSTYFQRTILKRGLFHGRVLQFPMDDRSSVCFQSLLVYLSTYNIY